MSLNDPLTAIVRVSPGEPLGTVMGRIRTWLDREKIQTTTFSTKVDARGFALTIGFHRAGDADRFCRQFSDAPSDGASSWPHSSAEGFGLSN